MKDGKKGMPRMLLGRKGEEEVARAAARYLAQSKDPRILPDTEVHFDVVAVTFDGARTEVEVFPDAFYPMYC